MFLLYFNHDGHFHILRYCSDPDYVTTVWFDSLGSLLSKLVSRSRSLAVSLSMSQKRSLFRGRFCVWVTIDVVEEVTVTVMKIVLVTVTKIVLVTVTV